MVRFSLFGIPIEIQPWFWITLALIGGGLSASSPEAFLDVAIFVLAGAVSILVHELGHGLTIRAFGAPTRIVLQAFGGYAAYPAGIFGRGKQFAISAAGPALQLLLALVAGLVLWLAPLPSLPSKRLLFFTVAVSVFWAVLNLLPVIPLDGGQMMASLLGRQRRSLALRISMITALAIGVLMLATTGSILFPIFLGIFAWRNFQDLRNFR